MGRARVSNDIEGCKKLQLVWVKNCGSFWVHMTQTQGDVRSPMYWPQKLLWKYSTECLITKLRNLSSTFHQAE